MEEWRINKTYFFIAQQWKAIKFEVSVVSLCAQHTIAGQKHLVEF